MFLFHWKTKQTISCALFWNTPELESSWLRKSVPACLGKSWAAPELAQCVPADRLPQLWQQHGWEQIRTRVEWSSLIHGVQPSLGLCFKTLLQMPSSPRVQSWQPWSLPTLHSANNSDLDWQDWSRRSANRAELFVGINLHPCLFASNFFTEGYFFQF